MNGEQLFDRTQYHVPRPEPDNSALLEQYKDWESEITPWPEPKLPIAVHAERVDEVLDKLLSTLQAGEFPYNLADARSPHIPENMPTTLERGGREHAMFHFACCYYMRGGIKSFTAYTRLGRLYDTRPDLFDCHKIVANLGSDVQSSPIDVERLAEELENDTLAEDVVEQLNPETPRAMVEQDIADALQAFGLGMHNTTARIWVENAIRMVDRYDGDPLEIFNGVTDYTEACRRIENDKKGNGFKGFKEKMVSMITYFLMDDGLIDSFKFPIPVDVHVLRVSILNGLISFPGVPPNTDLMRPETTDALRKVYLDYVVRKDADPLRLCDAVWLLSGLLCSKAPGNWTIEPLPRKFRDGKRTPLIVVDENPDDPKQMAAYEKSCRCCPVETTCNARMSATTWYIADMLAVRGPRMRFPLPPQGRLEVDNPD